MAKTILTRRDFLQAGGAVGGALAVTSCFANTRRTPPERPPNFLIILSDDHAYRAIGYNNPAVKTPAFDRLAHEGVIFDHVYVASPICVASRASMLTGLFPQQHGAIALDAGGFRRHVVDEARYKTLAHLLAQAGYTTAFCGKSHLGHPRDYGFAHGEEHRGPDDEATFAFAMRFLEERQGSAAPFLLWVAPHQPHLPLRPSPEWLDRYRDVTLQVDPNFRESPPEGSLYNQGLPGERYYRDSGHTQNYGNLPAGPPRSRDTMIEFIRAYYAVISHLDAQVGELMAQLQRTGFYQDTVVVYLSDNGYLLGNHGLGNKITMHEESVRVPMFIHWPALPHSGVTCPALVSSLDLLPTVLDLAQIPAPEHILGSSLVPLLARPETELRNYVASECVGVGGEKGTGHRMVRTAKWKYVLTGANDEALFDEEADAYERNNVAGLKANRRVLARMRRYMKEWMDRTGDTHQRPPIG